MNKEVSKLRELADEDLRPKLSSLRKELLDLRFKRAAKQLKNPLKFREVKRDIARILTILNERKGKGGSQKT